MKDKKVILSLAIGIVAMITLVVGATYAYFSVTSTNSFGTKTITATTPTVGSVALSSGSSLTMDLTAADMMKKGSDVTYYATASGKSTTATSPAIATATVTGSGTFNCSYTIRATASSTNSLYSAFNGMSGKSTGQIVLTIGGTAFDFYSKNFSNNQYAEVSGNLNGITSSTAASSRQVTAQFKFVNKNTVVQDALAGKDITFTFTATAFSCTAV